MRTGLKGSSVSQRPRVLRSNCLQTTSVLGAAIVDSQARYTGLYPIVLAFLVAVCVPVSWAAEATGGSGLFRNGSLVDQFLGGLSPGDSQTKTQSTESLFLSSPLETSQIPAVIFGPVEVSKETAARNAFFEEASQPAIKIQGLLRLMEAEPGRNLSADRKQLRKWLKELSAMESSMRSFLEESTRTTGDSNADPLIIERHAQTLQAFDAGSKEYKAAVMAVVRGEGDGAIERALEVVERLRFRNDPPLLQNADLPIQRQTESAPHLTRAEADEQLSLGAPVPQGGVAFAEPPGPDDLAATPDIQLSPEIISKATELGNSPLNIFEFVRNQVAYQPYLGSRKGSTETLRQLRGNDTDQASLLIALLRAAAIPSRYVRGSVEMTPERVMSWLGVDDASTAASILTTAGLDGLAIVDGPDVVSIRFTHVWVEAYVPYSNYRGISSEDTGKIWVALDPAFKELDISPGEDILTLMGFDGDTFQADYISTFTEPSPIEQLELDVQAYLDANDPGKNIDAIKRKATIKPQVLGLLPGSPAATSIGAPTRLSVLEDEKRYKVRFHLYNGGIDFIDHTINLPDLAGRRLTIEYQGATAADQAIIDANGGIYETPPNLVNVKPILKLDDLPVATSLSGIGMGYRHSSDMQFIHPIGANNSQPLVQNEIIAGNEQAIGFDTFLDVRDTFVSSQSFPAAEYLQGILHVTASDYLDRVNRGYERAGSLMGMVTVHDVSEAIVGNAISVAYSFGVPVTFEWAGLFVDADRRIVGDFAVDGGSNLNYDFSVLTGLDGSTMENRVFEDNFGQDAVSTIKILELSSDQGITICTIESSIFSDCPGFNHPALVAAINTALAQGHVVTIPQQPITVSLWSGTGYIDRDPATGAAGYIISGGINSAVEQLSGGATVDSWPVTLPCEATGVVGNVSVPPADSPAPGAVFCTDNSKITFKVKLTTTCKDGSTKEQDLSLTTHKSTADFGAGNYDLQLVAFGAATIRKITIVDVDKIEASEGDEWDDQDGSDDTKTVVLKKAASGDVTVTVTPKPNLAEANLPACWTLTGGTGAGKLSRTVAKSTAAKTSITAKSGTSEKMMDVVVAAAKFQQDAAGNTYGYDEMDPAVDDDDHVSVKKSGTTNVTVVMEGE